MITSSKYLQITPYCLLEYQYNTTRISTNNSTFARVYNAYTGSVSYVSHNRSDVNVAKELTGNTFETTVAQRRDNEWFHFDLDKPLKWFETQNNNIYIEGLWHETDKNGDLVYDLTIQPEQYVLYDTIKLHIVEGFNFEDLAGMILRVGYVDSGDFSSIYVANYAYLKENDNIEFHTTPFILGDRAYNRYITFKVPSLHGLSNANSVLKKSLAPTNPPFEIATPDITNSTINIIYYEVNKIVDENGQTVLYTNLPIGSDTNGIVRLTLEPVDALKNFAANVQESASGDYFELFPSYQGQFIEDFLYERSKFGEEYRVVHDIDVYEQISSYGNYIEQKNQSITFFQIEGFNKPFKYRPIIENSNAVAFTIDYTVRLVDVNDASNPIQTIRKASLTYPNAKKYGRNFTKIDIEQGFQPFKIVNKIINVDETAKAASVLDNSTKVIKEYADNYIFIDNSSISINVNNLFLDAQKNVLLNDANSLDSSVIDSFITSSVIYGQGEGVLLLHDFDNFMKITVYKLDTNGSPILYNTLATAKTYYTLVFEDTDGVKMRFSDLGVDNGYNITKTDGELLFKIDTNSVRKILKNPNNKFYITVSNYTSNEITDNTNKYEIVLYSGRYYSMDTVARNNYDFTSKESVLVEKRDEILAAITTLNVVKENVSLLLEKSNGIPLSEAQKNQLDAYTKEFETIIKKYSTL